MNLAIDLNTIVSGLALAAILYVAKTVTALEKRQAVSEEEARNQEDYARESRARIVSVEQRVGRLDVDVAKLQEVTER